MSQMLSRFLDHLAERFATLFAGMISSRVEGLRAVAQAEQQSHLEDLARHYEAEGKIDIAASLRQRALNLTSSDLAAEAVQIMQRTSAQRLASDTPVSEEQPAIPDFTSPPTKPRKKSPKLTTTPNEIFSSLPEQQGDQS